MRAVKFSIIRMYVCFAFSPCDNLISVDWHACIDW